MTSFTVSNIASQIVDTLETKIEWDMYHLFPFLSLTCRGDNFIGEARTCGRGKMKFKSHVSLSHPSDDFFFLAQFANHLFLDTHENGRDVEKHLKKKPKERMNQSLFWNDNT